MSEPIELFGALNAFCERLALPFFCTELGTGRFRVVNQALADFLGYAKESLLSGEVMARSVYMKEKQRDQWLHQILTRPGEVVTFWAEFNRVVRNGQSAAQRVWVAITSYLMKQADGPDLAIGILADVTEDRFEREVMCETIIVLKQILDLDWVNMGLHQINSQGNLVWMNQKERDLLGIEAKRLERCPHVCELSPPDQDWNIKRLRVQGKIRGENDLTVREHRTFCCYGAAKTDVTNVVPVNIHDFGISEPDVYVKQRKYRELFTVVRDERLPEEVAGILREFGPRNPLLEDLDVRTFVKVFRKSARGMTWDGSQTVLPKGQPDDLVFVYGNVAFCNEVLALAARDRPRQAIQNASDIYGKMEHELFPHHAGYFKSVDIKVISQGKEDQRLEKHPATLRDGEIDVRVLKIPLCAAGGNQPVGVQGFYWEVGDNKTEDICQRLTELYGPREILNNIPVPVYRIDRNLRHVYGNRAYLDEIKKLVPGVGSLGDVVGRRDDELFPAEMADAFQGDYTKILAGKESRVDRTERFGDRYIHVIKTPIRRGNSTSPGAGGESIVGVQSVFWEIESPGDPPHDESETWIDWKHHKLHVAGETSQDIHHSAKGKKWLLFEVLLMAKGGAVKFEEIADKVYQNPDMVQRLRSSNVDKRRKDVNNIENLKRHLVEAIQSLGLTSTKIAIDAVAGGHAYAMEFKNTNDSPTGQH